MRTPIFKHSLFALLSLASFAAVGCASSDGSTEMAGEAHDELVVKASSVWGKTIPVCWHPNSEMRDALLEARVQRGIAKSWEAVSNVKFVGWQTCPSAGPFPDMIYIHIRKGRASASIGKTSNNYVGLDFTDPMSLRATAIHEFGHSLGFYHEQVDARTPATCNESDRGDLRSAPADGIPVSVWDASSIMNYCNDAWREGALSRTDIEGVQKYYGARLDNSRNGNSLADVTGDGRADAIVVGGTRLNAMSSNGASFVNYRNATDGAFFGGFGTFFADVTGDGKSDAIAVDVDGVVVMPSNGSIFTSYRRWTNDVFLGGQAMAFADVTGDGKADGIAVNDDRIYVRPSTGVSFGPEQRWTEGEFYGARGTFFADVNGDGKTDAIAVNDGGLYVMTSNGAGFTDYRSWTSGQFFGERGTYFADVNGDGKADAVAVNNDGLYVMLSNGSQFTGFRKWTAGAFYGDRGTRFADVNGDGKADAVAYNSDRMYAMMSDGTRFTSYGAWTSGAFFSEP